jgi:hypothetical protein
MKRVNRVEIVTLIKLINKGRSLENQVFQRVQMKRNVK